MLFWQQLIISSRVTNLQMIRFECFAIVALSSIMQMDVHSQGILKCGHDKAVGRKHRIKTATKTVERKHQIKTSNENAAYQGQNKTLNENIGLKRRKC